MKDQKLSNEKKAEKFTKLLSDIRGSSKDLDISSEEITELVEEVRAERYFKNLQNKK